MKQTFRSSRHIHHQDAVDHCRSSEVARAAYGFVENKGRKRGRVGGPWTLVTGSHAREPLQADGERGVGGCKWWIPSKQTSFERRALTGALIHASTH